MSRIGDLAGKGPLGLKQPKPGKKPRQRMRTKRRRVTAEKLDPGHMAQVAQLACVVCGARPVEVHHCISDRYSQAKAPDTETIPLCWNHHMGPDGIHSRKKWWVEQFGKDTDYLPIVEQALKDML